VRDALLAFRRRVPERGGAQAAWTEAEGRPVLVLRVVAAGDREHEITVAFSPPTELWATAPRGPLTVAIALGDGVVDPDDDRAELVEGSSCGGKPGRFSATCESPSSMNSERVPSERPKEPARTSILPRSGLSADARTGR